MSEDNKQISEEMMTAITDVARNIAKDSDAMRLDMERIADALLPMIKQSGIRFGGLETWNSIGHKRRTCRIGIRNDNGRWTFGVEISSGVPLGRDGKGWKDIFCEEAYDTYWKVAEMHSFSTIKHTDLAQAVDHMPNFLEEYLNELDNRSVEFADLAIKAKAIRSIMGKKIKVQRQDQWNKIVIQISTL